MFRTSIFVLFVLLIVGFSDFAEGVVRRCYSCRSRSDRGSCKDPFTVNSTSVEKERGIEAIPCASGWCSKIIEGGNTFKDDDYGIATERQCLARGPSDSEERCAHTDWNHKKVYMCFCQGDLCNSAALASQDWITLCATLLIGAVAYRITH